MEGPSLVILKDEAKKFIGSKIINATGENKMDKQPLVGQTIRGLKTWGKHFLIVLDKGVIRIHFLMFGNYYIDSRHVEKLPKLSLELSNGEWNFYLCAVRMLDADPEDVYDWTSDVMNDNWNHAAAKRKLKQQPGTLVCDAFLDQTIFSGVGNIIKNEVFYRIKLHPESHVGALPAAKLSKLIKQARSYSFDFFDWKREGTLRQHWLAHTKKTCQRCTLPFVKKHTGLNPRRSFFCTNCQKLYLL